MDAQYTDNLAEKMRAVIANLKTDIDDEQDEHLCKLNSLCEEQEEEHKEVMVEHIDPFPDISAFATILYINYKCNPGKYLQRSKVEGLCKSYGPGTFRPVIETVFKKTINCAYFPSSLLRELEKALDQFKHWKKSPIKAKMRGTSTKILVRLPHQLKDFNLLMDTVASVMQCCPLLWSFYAPTDKPCTNCSEMTWKPMFKRHKRKKLQKTKIVNLDATPCESGTSSSDSPDNSNPTSPDRDDFHMAAISDSQNIRPLNALAWTCNHVHDWALEVCGSQLFADQAIKEEIDGEVLLLLNMPYLVDFFKIPTEEALHICHKILEVKVPLYERLYIFGKERPPH